MMFREEYALNDFLNLIRVLTMLQRNRNMPSIAINELAESVQLIFQMIVNVWYSTPSSPSCGGRYFSNPMCC